MLDDVGVTYHHVRVKQGGARVTIDLIDDADGYRIDTARHVNPEFWQAFVPAILERARAKGIPVVFGGSHVTFMAGEALKHADYVIRREGHVGWVQLYDWFRRGGARDELHAIAEAQKTADALGPGAIAVERCRGGLVAAVPSGEGASPHGGAPVGCRARALSDR